ncbi:Uncharacterised protein at_DN1914 [Pycnogonum litorale]
MANGLVNTTYQVLVFYLFCTVDLIHKQNAINDAKYIPVNTKAIYFKYNVDCHLLWKQVLNTFWTSIEKLYICLQSQISTKHNEKPTGMQYTHYHANNITIQNGAYIVSKGILF